MLDEAVKCTSDVRCDALNQIKLTKNYIFRDESTVNQIEAESSYT